MTNRRFLLVGLLSCCVSTQAYAESEKQSLTLQNLHLTYQNISKGQAEGFLARSWKQYQRAKKFFGWKSDPRIRIVVSDSFAKPSSLIGKNLIVIPANRIRGDAGGPPFMRGRGPGMLHNYVELLVRPTDRWWGTMLKIGLAVYLQDKFGGAEKAYPNLGKDIHLATIRSILAFERFVPLRSVERLRTRRTRGRQRRMAMLIQGSFARWLIENGGKQRYLRLMTSGTPSNIYGRTMCQLENRWVELLVQKDSRLKPFADLRRPCAKEQPQR